MANQVPRLLDQALGRLTTCSNDPVCDEHRADDRHDGRHLHGAACHGCLLVPETSCEARNGRLDRRLIYGWRRDLRRKGVLPAEAPVRFVALSMAPGRPDEADRVDVVVEIVLRGGRGLRVPVGLGNAALMRLIRVTKEA